MLDTSLIYLASQCFYQSEISTSYYYIDLFCEFGSVRIFDGFQFTHCFLEANIKEGL